MINKEIEDVDNEPLKSRHMKVIRNLYSKSMNWNEKSILGDFKGKI